MLHLSTPLEPWVPPLSRSHFEGMDVRLKLESSQPTGSFKIRGVGYACEAYRDRGVGHFLSSSGGNAGIAVAYAGRKLGIPVTVVVPETATRHAQNLILEHGAELIVHGESWQEAHAHAESLQTDQTVLIHPFDDPLLWQGHASLVDEVAEAMFQPQLIITSVGGGGLLSGIAEGIRRQSWSDTHVLAMETLGAESFAESLKVGQPVELAAITSVATSLGARQVCQRSIDLTRDLPVSSGLVSDRAAVAACASFLNDRGLLVEPACGASLAALYEELPMLLDYESILVVVCGGTTMTESHLQMLHGELCGS